MTLAKRRCEEGIELSQFARSSPFSTPPYDRIGCPNSCSQPLVNLISIEPSQLKHEVRIDAKGTLPNRCCNRFCVLVRLHVPSLSSLTPLLWHVLDVTILLLF